MPKRVAEHQCPRVLVNDRQASVLLDADFQPGLGAERREGTGNTYLCAVNPTSSAQWQSKR